MDAERWAMASRHRVCAVSYSVSRGSGSRTSGSMEREAPGRGGRTGRLLLSLRKEWKLQSDTLRRSCQGIFCFEDLEGRASNAEAERRCGQARPWVSSTPGRTPHSVLHVGLRSLDRQCIPEL